MAFNQFLKTHILIFPFKTGLLKHFLTPLPAQSNIYATARKHTAWTARMAKPRPTLRLASMSCPQPIGRWERGTHTDAPPPLPPAAHVTTATAQAASSNDLEASREQKQVRTRNYTECARARGDTHTHAPYTRARPRADGTVLT